MDTEPESAIARFVAHHGGPTAVSLLLGGTPVYQEVQRWLRRGWASPMHLFRLEPHLPAGMTLHDLNDDRERALKAGAEQPAMAKAAA